MRLGIDVGGTNTDAVVLDDRRVVAVGKVATTPDVTSGILSAIHAALREVPVSRFEMVVVGTTHFMNALAEARQLAPVAVIRLATPPQTLSPLIDWPPEQRAAIGDHTYVCLGGAQYDGRELHPLDEAHLCRIVDEIRDQGVLQVAISGTFSPVNPAAEIRAEEIVRDRLPGVSVTLSHNIGRVGMLERENATVLNASLQPLAAHVIEGLSHVLAEAGITAPIYLSQNDGTVMSLAFASEYPIFSISSGPTNSMRGAAFLSGIDDCIVIDVGGTTSDVGLLRGGFPRESPIAVKLAGVRNNFRMPDVQNLALGGGSVISADGMAGPHSVGYQLTHQARVFGGDTVTLTDIAVAAGVARIGDDKRVTSLPAELVASAMSSLRERLAEAVELAKLVESDLPVVVVGGGAVLVDEIPGVSKLVRPDYGQVANAVGAAFAQVGGEINAVYQFTSAERQEVMDRVRGEAVQRAIDAGAIPDTVTIIDEEDVPLPYLPDGTAIRVRIKAIGEIDLASRQ